MVARLSDLATALPGAPKGAEAAGTGARAARPEAAAPRRGAAGEAGLGTTLASISTAIRSDQREQARSRRSERYALRRAAGDLLGDQQQHRVWACGRRAVGMGGEGGGVGVRLADGHAGIAGLETCGSVWACPVCAAKIQAARAEELGQVLAWARGEQKTLAMLTLTVRHTKRDSLSRVWDTVTGAWADVTAGAAWGSESKAEYEKRCESWMQRGRESDWDRAAGLTQATGARRAPRGWAAGIMPQRTIGLQEQHGLLGWAKIVEATVGERGWHVHLHVVLVLDDAGDLGDIQARQLGAGMGERWRRAVARRGMSASREHGYDLAVSRAAEQKLSEYLTKTGDHEKRAEITRDMGKKARNLAAEATLGGFKQGRAENRVPFQVLADAAATGDMDDVALWRHWVEGSTGRKSLTWSEELRTLAGLAKKERTDDEIAAETVGSEDDTIAILPGTSWMRVYPVADQMLDAAERGGAAGLYRWLEDQGVPYVVPDGEGRAGVLKPHGSRWAGGRTRVLGPERP